MEASNSNIIPGNIKGKPNDVTHSVILNSKEEAIDLFRMGLKRMLNVNTWHKLSGFASAEFILRDQDGNECERPARLGDFIQIDIPGPGPVAGEGYDWVHVEALEDKSDPAGEEESFGIRVRSCKDPNINAGDTAHFFTSDATSTFLIYRKQNTVSSSYHGRNEVLNTDTENLRDKLRNTIVGTGALIGISELQWKSLITAFLENEV